MVCFQYALGTPSLMSVVVTVDKNVQRLVLENANLDVSVQMDYSKLRTIDVSNKKNVQVHKPNATS